MVLVDLAPGLQDRDFGVEDQPVEVGDQCPDDRRPASQGLDTGLRREYIGPNVNIMSTSQSYEGGRPPWAPDRQLAASVRRRPLGS